jgi:hypothetical protein
VIPQSMVRERVSGVVFLAAVMCAVVPVKGSAQVSDQDLERLRLLSTPIGALPAISLPMAASRNHNYWIGRVQGGYRRGPSGSSLPAGAAGLDFQYRGGSIVGVTAGYQKRDCGLIENNCGGHALFGVRSQLNLVTGGSMFAGLLRDNSTTSTLGTEIGLGYAPNVAEGMNACTLDVGLPFSVAKRRQRPRLVGFVTPGMMWDKSCGSSGPPTRKTYFTGFGVALQQLGNRSLDVYLGVQKVFRANTGYETGISFTYVRLP